MINYNSSPQRAENLDDADERNSRDEDNSENANSAPRNAPVAKSVLGSRNALNRQMVNIELQKPMVDSSGNSLERQRKIPNRLDS